jgi:outer membrane immunogenic protein
MEVSCPGRTPGERSETRGRAGTQGKIDWSGFYIGVGVGFRSTEADWNVTSVTDNGVEFLASECAALAAGPCVTGEPLNDTAFRVSPYLGVNWQFAPQGVIGVEADWGSASKTTTLQGMAIR